MISKTIKFILSLCMMIGLLSPIPSYAVEEEEMESIQNDAFVIGEDETRRTESSKTFIMSDDSYQQVIYGVPVHYENDNGEYENIDNTLIAASDSEEEFETAQSDMKIRFSKKMHKSNLARIDYGDYRITWGLKDMERRSDAVIESHDSHSDDIRLNALDNISGSVRYDDVMDHVSLRYGFDSLRVKEDIILEQYVSDSTFTFTYRTDNMKLEKNSDGEIEARDNETDEVIFIMPRAYMYDADNKTSYDVDYSMIGSNGHYEITVIPDDEWLSDSERVYPVVIDPVIETETKKSAIDSTFITSWQGATNHSNKLELLVGTETSEYGYCRTLMKFALPELRRGDMVTGAELVVAGYRNVFHSSSTPDMQVNAHMITSSWSLGSVTWNTKPDHETDPVLDYDHFRREDTTGSTNWKRFDITRAVKRWYEGNSANNGIMLKARTESTDYAQYAVKSYIWPERYNEQENAYPRIVISYRNTKGLESYYDYTSAGTSNGDEIHINTYNGNPVVVRTDLSAPGGKNPATLGHVYNGYMLDVNAGDIRPWTGVGWRLNVQQTVRATALGEKYPYVYTDGDGTEHYFMKTDTGELRDEDGLGLTLKEESSGGYTIKSATKSHFTFNSYGNLTKMTDEYGNDITVTYKSDKKTISTISDETGYVITLESYETGAEAGYLKTASDNKGNTSTFYYSQKRLISIISSDNRKNASYTYDANGNLIKIACRDGSYMTMSYTSGKSGYRVSGIGEYGTDKGKGQTIWFDRSKYLLTDITTSGRDSTIGTADDVVTQCQFDSSGRLITCYAKTNGNELGAYSQKLSSSSPNESGSDVKRMNRYERMANLSPTVDNMLKNHAGNTTSGWSHSAVGSATFAFVSDDSRSYFGTKAFRVSVSQSDTDARARFYQDIDTPYIQPNTTYTASAYIRTIGVNEVSGQSNGGAALLAYMEADSLSTKGYASEYVTGTTDEKVNDGWRRVSVTFTTPSDIEYVRFNALVRGATGTAYFDGLQLEKGSTASPYNMMENGGMERVSSSMPEGWSSQQLASSDKSVTSSYRYGSRSFSIAPDASKKKELYQEVSVKGDEQDTYVLSGWSKGTGVLERSNQGERKYKISVQIIYSDNSDVWKTPAEFTYAVGEWKYAATSFNLSDGTGTDKTPTKIRVCLRAHGQANKVIYDGIQLTRKDIDICSYDSNGNLKKSGKTTYTYTGDNLLGTSTDSTGKKTTYEYYNGTSKVYKVSDDRTYYMTTYAYDSHGNVTAEAKKKKDDGKMIIRTETVYDSTGSYVTSMKDENGYASTSTYTEKGLLSSFTDAKGTATAYTYDSLDRLTAVSEGNMGHTVSYNEESLPSSINTGSTNYSFTYDEFGNMTGVKVGAQTISSNTYSPYNGGLATSSTGNGVTCTYEYDDRGSLVKVRRNGTLIQHIVYDREGTLLESRNYSSGLATRYRYDFDGNVTGADVYVIEGEPLNDRWKYGTETGYDEHGRVVRTSVRTHGSSYISDSTYTRSGKTETSTSGGKKVEYTYDALDRQTKRRIVMDSTAGINLDITYAYKDSARGADHTTNQLLAERVGGVKYEYAYDRNGNITSINRTDSSNNGKVIYTYDSHDQLIREDNSISQTSTSYAYDANGNVTSKTVKNYANGTIGSQISSVSYNYGSAISGDRLTKIGNEAIGYDSIGNPLNMDGWTLSWSGRRLTSMTKGNDTISFGYDAEGRRISKTVNGAKTRYFYIGDTIAGEDSAANGKIAYIYDDAGRISALRRTINGTTTTYHLLTNSRGDVEAIYLSDGTLIARYIYDAYGNEIMKEYGSTEAHRGMANINSFRYRGYMYDRETGYYYLMSRYYNPTIGRFVNADTTEILIASASVLTDNNLYSYCDNNPIMRKDYGGEYWETALDILSLAVTIKDTINNPRDPLNYVALVGDIVDVITPISGVGETVKTVKAVDKIAETSSVVSKSKNLSKMGRKGKQARLKELVNDDKLSSALRGEIKRDINEMKRGRRKIIRVPSGYELSHRIGFPARKGYSYKYSDLNIKKQHRKHHSIFGWRY